MTRRKQKVRLPWPFYFCIITITARRKPSHGNHQSLHCANVAYILAVYALSYFPASVRIGAIPSFGRATLSKQAYKIYNTRQKPKMCLRVRVFYQCRCDATRASGLWSCHGYVGLCYDNAGRECSYMLANDCGRPTCQAVRNYWSWHVHYGVCDQQHWLSFIQSYGRWCDAGANDQLSSQEVIHHPYEHNRPVWTPEYPRYDQPGFNFLAFSKRSHPFKAKDQTPPPWPILDVPSAMLGSDHEEYPALNMVVREEDIEWHVDIPRRLTVEQVHLYMASVE